MLTTINVRLFFVFTINAPNFPHHIFRKQVIKDDIILSRSCNSWQLQMSQTAVIDTIGQNFGDICQYSVLFVYF